MHSWRTHSAWLLLALFLLGGVAAPAAHQMQHDTAHARVTVLVDHDWRPHSEADHSVEADADSAGSHAFYCLLCHTQLVSAFGQQVAATAPPLQAAALSITSSFVWSLSRLAPSLIRGPPATA